MSRKAWGIIHNLIVHPLMVVLPPSLGDYLHKVTGELAFTDDQSTPSPAAWDTRLFRLEEAISHYEAQSHIHSGISGANYLMVSIWLKHYRYILETDWRRTFIDPNTLNHDNPGYRETGETSK